MSGERAPLWNPAARGVFFGLDLSHSRGDLARAILESVALSVREMVEVMKQTGAQVRTLQVVGGGAGSDLWNQIRADSTGLPVARPKLTEGTATGILLLTGLGIGLFISTVAKTQQEAQVLGMLIQLPSMFLAGFLFPIAAMPPFLQALSYLMPLRYFNIIVRGIMLKGVGVEAFSGDVLALVIFCVAIMALAVSRFHKTLD